MQVVQGISKPPTSPEAVRPFHVAGRSDRFGL